jgi:hypothetical protein
MQHYYIYFIQWLLNYAVVLVKNIILKYDVSILESPTYSYDRVKLLRSDPIN